VLAGAVLFAGFYGLLLVTILRGEADEQASIGECAVKISASLLVAAASVFVTGGGAVFGLVFIFLFLGWAALFGKRRKW
jgi:hypothetical protein